MSFGPTEILVVLAIVLLLFGGKKLPELARGAGKSLRIFKAEVSEDADDKRSIEATPGEAVEPVGENRG